jgi:ABC-type metal ion transport system, periplasmic component/surface adhesin
MKRLITGILLSSVLLLSACTTDVSTDASKPIVVTTLFPQYSIVEALAGDYVNNVFILPFGMDAHDFEPTPSDVTTMLRADVLIYTGDLLESWVDQVIKTQQQSTLTFLDLSQVVDLLEDDHDDHDADHDDHDDEHDADLDDHDDDHDDHGDFDPHYWLDPHNLEEMAEAIAATLIELLPEQAQSIQNNLSVYLEAIEQYEADVVEALSNAQTRTLIHGGHNAFGYFAAHFGLEYMTPYAGFSTELEPSPQARAELIRTMSAVGSSVIFAEEFINPRVASVISQETGAEIVYLFTGENTTEELYNEGVTLLDMLYLNLERIKRGLNVTN